MEVERDLAQMQVGEADRLTGCGEERWKHVGKSPGNGGLCSH
jgi:hypothetical protein